ncbi:MAG: hypothetical protein KUG82_03445 [Pseudomonadales bacterium]|nr:hypothetical protein [Pseudomonadales bacterium]
MDTSSLNSSDIKQYAVEHNIEGLTENTLQKIMVGELKPDKAGAFLLFQQRINQELLTHKVITHNTYTQWFEKGGLSFDQVKHFLIQFSVFSNQFLVAQLHKMLNAETVEEMHASKEILANELGVVFSKGHSNDVLESADGLEGEGLVGLEGSVDGSVFRFEAAHFEWLVSLANNIGVEFSEMGRRSHGASKTLHFCDELIRLYGSEQFAIASAASYAVENWAAAGFWEELISGLKIFKQKNKLDKFPLAFFTWHSKLEANHAHHTQQEIEEYFFTHEVDEDSFIQYGNEMLDGVAVFWEGLYESRNGLH